VGEPIDCWAGELRESTERIVQNCVLNGGVVRLTGFKAERKIQKLGARRAACGHDVECAAKDQGRQASGFKVSGDQTHGLMADRSQWHKEQEIQSLPCDCRLECRDELISDPAL